MCDDVGILIDQYSQDIENQSGNTWKFFVAFVVESLGSRRNEDPVVHDRSKCQNKSLHKHMSHTSVDACVNHSKDNIKVHSVNKEHLKAFDNVVHATNITPDFDASKPNFMNSLKLK